MLRLLRTSRPLRRGHAAFVLGGAFDRERVARLGLSDDDHASAAIDWLRRAQDASEDGGFAGRYRLDRGWTSSYPETTGYIVPTLLDAARAYDRPELVARAARAIDFLLALQLPSGAFPGLEVAENRTEPSPFNTAQIVCGLVAWHRERGDERALIAARRAGEWLASVQDEDGAWRKHVYLGVPATYHAHASCWLVDLAAATGDARFARSAERHLDWVLRHRDAASGFIDACGFTKDDHAARRSVTHTLAYTLAGTLHTSIAIGRADGIDAVRDAAERIARRFELEGSLPGVLDHRFRRGASWSCPTGTVQTALVWMRLFERDGDVRLLNAALKAIDRVKDVQAIGNRADGLRGGIPGSDPPSGGYLHLAAPNWAAKFFLDALLAKRRVLAGLAADDLAPRTPGAAPSAPRSLSPAVTGGARSPKIVLLAPPRSAKCARLLAALDREGVRPDAIVVESRPDAPIGARLRAALRRDGFEFVRRKLRGAPLTPMAPMSPPGPTRRAPGEIDVRALAKSRGIPVVEVGSLEDAATLERLRALAPDLFVTAGVGILRAPLLAIPKLGTVNAHMGALPGYRGMNVAEWAALHGDPVTVTVHLVDAGIDTGDLLLAAEVDVAGKRTIAELRDAADEAQVALLARVLHAVRDAGDLPPRTPQRRDQGRQFFTMHPALRALLEQRLAARAR